MSSPEKPHQGSEEVEFSGESNQELFDEAKAEHTADTEEKSAEDQALDQMDRVMDEHFGDRELLDQLDSGRVALENQAGNTLRVDREKFEASLPAFDAMITEYKESGDDEAVNALGNARSAIERILDEQR